MDKKLEKWADDLSVKDAETFADCFAELADPVETDSDFCERVLSSTMRKAGFEMNETNVKVTKGKKRFGKMMIFGIAAAAVLSAVGWTAVSGGFERVKEYFAQDISPYADMINNTSKTVSDDDITLSVDGVVVDEVQCRVVVSVTPKTKRGEEIVGQLSYSSHGYLDDCYKLQTKAEKHGGTEDEAHEWYVEQVKNLPPHRFSLYFENAGKTSGERYREDMTDAETADISYENVLDVSDFIYYENNNKYHFYDMFTFEMSALDRTQPLILHERESGLSIELDLNEYLNTSPTAIDSHRLVSDDPNAYDYVVISPLAIYIRATQNDLDSGRILKDSGELTSVTVNYTDGTSEQLTNICISKSTEDGEDFPEFDTEQERLDYIKEHWDEQKVTGEMLEANGDKLLTLDRIASVIIDGVTYTIDV